MTVVLQKHEETTKNGASLSFCCVYLALPYLSEAAANLQVADVLEQGLRDAGIHEA
jgi:hypothetical protein